jgi:hypothetical protein
MPAIIPRSMGGTSAPRTQIEAGREVLNKSELRGQDLAKIMVLAQASTSEHATWFRLSDGQIETIFPNFANFGTNPYLGFLG